MEVVSVEMDYIERISAARHAIERYEVMGERIFALRIKPQRALAGRRQDRISLRIAASE
jgi:hypothetical protein